ncbi:MAG TPA: hypothetical protein VKB76_05795, partial [Ktedonobacterales bacterium]|nr:hypothetical protein [Ktedonobacterales bacterium]
AWRDWMTNRWVPTIHALQAQRGDAPEEYSRLIAETGAQTTLICTALLPGDAPQQVRVELLAVGDAEAFHVEREDGRWVVRQAFPFSAPDQFGAQPAMLATIDSPQWREHSWQHRATQTLTAQVGDRVVLTSDTLAEWLLHDRDARMRQLLALQDEADFERLIEQERQAGQMKDDDVTLLIIPML